MAYVVLALGSNVGNRREFLVRAVSELDDIARVVAKSKIYETAPWGYSQQRYFLNAAIGIETACGPLSADRETWKRRPWNRLLNRGCGPHRS